MNRKSVERGFTLVELLIVIAIIVIILGLVGLALDNSVEKAKTFENEEHLRRIQLVLESAPQLTRNEKISLVKEAISELKIGSIIGTSTDIQTFAETVVDKGIYDDDVMLNGVSLNESTGRLTVSP